MRGIKLYLLLAFFSVVFANEQHSKYPYVLINSPHKMQILEYGPAAFQKRLDLIHKAKKNINLEYFIFKDDHVGRLLTRALVAKAKEGVKVRMLIDKMWSSINRVHLYYYRKAGIEIKYYNTKSMLKTRSVQFRNHRKMLSIDGKEIIVGGRNIGDEYFNLNPDWNFVDRDLYLSGAIVKKIDESFDKFWQHKYSKATKEVVDTGFNSFHTRAREFFNFDVKGKELNAIEEKITSIGNEQNLQSPIHECQSVIFVTDDPGRNKESRIMGPYLYEQIEKAQDNVMMDTAYFVIKKDDKEFLNKVLEKGIK